MFKIGLENKLFYKISSDLPDGIVKSRVLYLLKWYRKKAQRYKFLTYAGTSASILLPATLALLNSKVFDQCLPDGYVQNLQVILPILCSAGAALYAFLQCKDNWIRYRTAVEQIKQETICYIAQHKNENPIDSSAENTFLKTIEDICSSEFTEWRRNRIDTTIERKEKNDLLGNRL